MTSVVGIDFGNFASKIGVAREKGIDVILNETSNRATPSLVSFGVKSRAIGEAAKTLETSNFKNTIGSLKRLVGRSLSEPEITEVEKQYINAQLVDVDGTVGVKVNYLGKTNTFSATQLVAMYLGKLRDIAAPEIKATPSDVVISVPGWYNDIQRRAILDAAHIAGLNPLRLINDTAAIALGYGITKSDLPELDAPRNVVFVDIGHSNYSVAVVALAKGGLLVRSAAYDRNFGGRNIDLTLVKHFAAEFKEKYKIDVLSNPKAVFRLLTSCEKLKRELSANAEAPLHVENIMNDVDASSKLTREHFEGLIGEPLSRITAPLEEALLEASLTPDQIHSIELVGGSTRIPAIRTRIRDFFGSNRELSSTLNADEAVCRGATFACAMLSPVFHVHEFKVLDITQYPIKTSRQRVPKEGNTEVVVFPRGNSIPSTKLLTVYYSAPFKLEASYAEPEKVHGPNKIGSFECKNVAPGANGDPVQIKVKTSLNLHGILSFDGAQLIEEVTGPEPPKPRKLVKKTDLPVVTRYTSLDAAVLEKFSETEALMHAADKLVADTEDRKNALEEYMYGMRSELYERLAPFVLPDEKSKILELAQQVEDWLDSEEGEEASKSAYVERLDGLHALGDPVTNRYREHEARPRAVAQLRETIGAYMSQVNQSEFAHIDEAERNKVVKRCATEQQWLDDKSARQLENPKTANPILTSAEILERRDELIYFSQPIMSKPKPKPQPTSTTETPQEEKQERERRKERRCRRAEPTHSPRQSSRSDNVVDAWTSYEQRWSTLSASSTQPVTFHDIPWPLMRVPTGPESITPQAVGAFLLSPLHSQDKSRKERLRNAMLRWRSGKFEGRWMARIDEEQKPKVREAMGAVARALTELMTNPDLAATAAETFNLPGSQERTDEAELRAQGERRASEEQLLKEQRHAGEEPRLREEQLAGEVTGVEEETRTPSDSVYIAAPSTHSPIVSSVLTCSEIITLLGERGCENLTDRLNIQSCSPYAVSSGGFGDVYSGRLVDGNKVAIKTIRPRDWDGLPSGKYHKRAAKELYTWSKCRHPNVVPLLGLAEFRDGLALISPWAENGNLHYYIRANSSVDRCSLSTSISEGLVYLHENGIVHGDLKGANVLISDDQTPLLADFGNASLAESTVSFTATASPSFSPRWTAPEILDESSSHSPAADVYALGMTILEIFTGQVPFSNVRDMNIHRTVLDKRMTPPRPEDQIPTRSVCGNILWSLLMSCWAFEPELRPRAAQVRDIMKTITPESLLLIEARPNNRENES